ncbi:type II toxin-antitoxin system RelE/ParE family toxin [Longimicrobium sp.]|uniref:type II toxin-antitoxin system RelE/ParE family toxin n=1 Tax=Longimicrobium sp. TaxID=2029185 RepID=UPI003B3BCBCE
MSVDEKPLHWLGASYRELTSFPLLARIQAGFDLGEVQNDREPDDWKPMESVGPGAREIRVRTFDGGVVQHRVVYVAKYQDAVYVLHAFAKKTEQTSPHNLDVARVRYREMVKDRESRTGKR